MVAHRRAVETVAARARIQRDEAVGRLRRALGMRGATELVERFGRGLRAGLGRVTVNFHPDRVGANGMTAARGLATSGRYESQWTTWTSSGGRFAVPGGDRHRWESMLFGDAYETADPASTPFPIYGAWDLLSDPHGGSPRYGSCFLVLDSRVQDRLTMCVGDSHVGPVDLGTWSEPWSVLAGLAEQAASGRLLGRPVDLDGLGSVLRGAAMVTSEARNLDDYVEVQVHGGIDCRNDVEMIVADPSFRGTPVGDDLATAAEAHRCELRWHRGSVLAVQDVPADFRGPAMPPLARLVAEGHAMFDAHAIGVAFSALALTPPSSAGDAPDSSVQRLKQLWHTLLAHGVDAE